jgi:ribosomal-protein-alanine N-acetyltransferase
MRELAQSLRMRRMVHADLPQVMEIEKDAFTNAWSEEMVRKELAQDWSTVYVVEETTPRGWLIRAFAIFWLVHDEIHVLNVATHRDHRRLGLGRYVMDEVVSFGRQHKCRIATLEVRRSNEAAIGLYKALGFRPVGMRPNYYSDNHEDGVVMVMDL